MTCLIRYLKHHNKVNNLTIGGGAGEHRPPNDGVGGHHALWAPPTLTSVDRNKTYCFHKLVLNLPAPLDIQ